MIEFYRWETRGTRYELMFIRVEHPDAARKGWLIAGPWGWGEVNISHVGFIGDWVDHVDLGYHIEEKMGMKAWPESCDGCAVAEMIAAVLDIEPWLPKPWYDQTPERFDKEAGLVWRQD